jgi:hypothetical protein
MGGGGEEREGEREGQETIAGARPRRTSSSLTSGISSPTASTLWTNSTVLLTSTEGMLVPILADVIPARAVRVMLRIAAPSLPPCPPTALPPRQGSPGRTINAGTNARHECAERRRKSAHLRILSPCMNALHIQIYELQISGKARPTQAGKLFSTDKLTFFQALREPSVSRKVEEDGGEGTHHAEESHERGPKEVQVDLARL